MRPRRSRSAPASPPRRRRARCRCAGWRLRPRARRAPRPSCGWACICRAAAAGAQLAALAERAQRFTPRVSLEPPDGLLLEVRGSLHLFAGISALRAALLGECRGLQLQAQLACAPTPLAALCGARAGRPFEILEPAQLVGQLAPLPLTVLRWPEDTVARLGRLGVRTVGAALRLPRAGFARRFGPAALATLDRLTGRAPEVRAAFAPGVRFRRRRELDCELTSHARLLAALTPLCAELGAFLRRAPVRRD